MLQKLDYASFDWLRPLELASTSNGALLRCRFNMSEVLDQQAELVWVSIRPTLAGGPGSLESHASSPPAIKLVSQLTTVDLIWRFSFLSFTSLNLAISTTRSTILQPLSSRHGFATLSRTALQGPLPVNCASPCPPSDHQPETISGHTGATRHTECRRIQGADCNGLSQYGRAIHNG